MPEPGWYRDPYSPAGLRWWDGQRWTQHWRALAPPPSPLPGYAGRNERTGRLAMLIWAPVQVLAVGLLGYAFGRFFRDLDALASAPSGDPAEFPLGSFVLMLVASLSGVLMWVPLVLMALWTHRCATTAAALRIPARHEPVWAAVGWIIPVISFWFPYQSVRDCLPPDHPARREVAWWWAGIMAASVIGGVAVFMAMFDTAVFAMTLVVLAAIAVATAFVGVRVARAIDEAHLAAMAR